jgi:hypothetical protein
MKGKDPKYRNQIIKSAERIAGNWQLVTGKTTPGSREEPPLPFRGRGGNFKQHVEFSPLSATFAAD